MILTRETPHWLIAKGKTHEARKVLQWLRGKTVDVEPELNRIKNSNQPRNYKIVLVLFLFVFLQHFSGIYSIPYRAHVFFSVISVNYFEIIFLSVLLCGTIVAAVVTDPLGRKVI